MKELLRWLILILLCVLLTKSASHEFATSILCVTSFFRAHKRDVPETIAACEKPTSHGICHTGKLLSVNCGHAYTVLYESLVVFPEPHRSIHGLSYARSNTHSHRLNLLVLAESTRNVFQCVVCSIRHTCIAIVSDCHVCTARFRIDNSSRAPVCRLYTRAGPGDVAAGIAL